MVKFSELLAFVHIEKAAGTSLIHLLRKNFFPGYMDVRPLCPNSHRIFTAADFKIYRQINPWICAIGGHSVKPHSDLETAVDNVKYVTVLRDPIDRYLSQYYYWCRKLGKTLTFESYLELEGPKDFQVKKIAPDGRASTAKSILGEKFFAVGVVEQFNEFLELLARRLKPKTFSISYKVRNVNRRSGDESYKREYRSRIIENNLGDIELYNFVLDELLPKMISESLEDQILQQTDDINRLTPIVDRVISSCDFALRHTYIQPITSLIRVSNGLPAKGSYTYN